MSLLSRLALIGSVAILPVASWAQGPATSAIKIFSDIPQVRFNVDGLTYSGSATFNWPAGSKHYLAIPSQNGNDDSVIYAAEGWVDNKGNLLSNSSTQTITADPAITSLKTTGTVQYRVRLTFYNDPSNTVTPALCGAPGDIPANQFRPGLVYFSGAPQSCYWNSTQFYVAPSTYTVNAFPFPGFVFTGFIVNGSGLSPYLTQIPVTGPLDLVVHFEPARRVRFMTAPAAGLQVTVDKQTIPTIDPSFGACQFSQHLPVGAPATITPLCFGDFDFAPGSSHLIGAASPQTDRFGNVWVFDKFSNGQGQNATYVANGNPTGMDVLTANFVPGLAALITTNPPNLKLTVDGQDKGPYSYMWALNSTHQISAPATQVDANGRKYVFTSFSNGGPADQSLTVDQNFINASQRLVANYQILNRLTVQSSPKGLSLQVDGSTCRTPCVLDKPSGTAVQVTAPGSIPVRDGVRLDLNSWTDGGNADHTVSLTSDTTDVTVLYNTLYRLSSGSNPASGVNYQFDPASPDLFYSDGTSVTVTANAKPGFKFRRWAGDLSGTFAQGTVIMSAPRNVVAMLDTVPYIAPAGVKNAAGDTPDGTLAPGSIISIFGTNLAPSLQLGPVNPLAQTLAGVTVSVADRLLPLLFVSPDQVNAQLPSDLPEGDYTLYVRSAGNPDIPGSFTVSRDAPGVFTRTFNDRQYALASHEDGTPITPDSPARSGETITVYGTGFGPLDRKIIDGFATPASPLANFVDPVQVLLGSSQPTLQFTGSAPGYVGTSIAKFAISSDMPTASTLELKVQVNGKTSNTVLLPLE